MTVLNINNMYITTIADLYVQINYSLSLSLSLSYYYILRLEEYLWTNDNQFGFKSGHSTDICIYASSEFIEYFKAVLLLYMLDSLMQVRLSIKSVIGLFSEN